MCFGFGLLVAQSKQSEDVTLDLGSLCKLFFSICANFKDSNVKLSRRKKR